MKFNYKFEIYLKILRKLILLLSYYDINYSLLLNVNIYIYNINKKKS